MPDGWRDVPVATSTYFKDVAKPLARHDMGLAPVVRTSRPPANDVDRLVEIVTHCDS